MAPAGGETVTKWLSQIPFSDTSCTVMSICVKATFISKTHSTSQISSDQLEAMLGKSPTYFTKKTLLGNSKVSVGTMAPKDITLGTPGLILVCSLITTLQAIKKGKKNRKYLFLGFLHCARGPILVLCICTQFCGP